MSYLSLNPRSAGFFKPGESSQDFVAALELARYLSSAADEASHSCAGCAFWVARVVTERGSPVRVAQE